MDEDELYRFLKLVKHVTDNDSVVLQLIKKQFKKANKDFLQSSEFRDAFHNTKQKIKVDPEDKFVHITELLTLLKDSRKRKTSNDDKDQPLPKKQRQHESGESEVALDSKSKPTEEKSEKEESERKIATCKSTTPSAAENIKELTIQQLPLTPVKLDRSASSEVKLPVKVVPELLLPEDLIDTRALRESSSELSVINLDNDSQEELTIVPSHTDKNGSVTPPSVTAEQSADDDACEVLSNTSSIPELQEPETSAAATSEPVDDRPTPVKGSRKQLKKLEVLLQRISEEIQKLERRELTLDELEDDDSAYAMEDRYKKKFVKVWNKYCEVAGQPPSTGRPTERKFRFEGTRYDKINKKIEQFVNKKQVFPDYHDVRDIVMSCNKKYTLHITKNKIDHIARDAFTVAGNELQKRRLLDFNTDFDSRCREPVKPYSDPALYDRQLRDKLEKNTRTSQDRMAAVLEKYARKQENSGDQTDDSEYESEEEESDHISGLEENEIEPVQLDVRRPSTSGSVTVKRRAATELLPSSSIRRKTPCIDSDSSQEKEDNSPEPAYEVIDNISGKGDDDVAITKVDFGEPVEDDSESSSSDQSPRIVPISGEEDNAEVIDTDVADHSQQSSLSDVFVSKPKLYIDIADDCLGTTDKPETAVGESENTSSLPGPAGSVSEEGKENDSSQTTSIESVKSKVEEAKYVGDRRADKVVNEESVLSQPESSESTESKFKEAKCVGDHRTDKVVYEEIILSQPESSESIESKFKEAKCEGDNRANERVGEEAGTFSQPINIRDSQDDKNSQDAIKLEDLDIRDYLDGCVTTDAVELKVLLNTDSESESTVETFTLSNVQCTPKTDSNHADPISSTAAHSDCKTHIKDPASHTAETSPRAKTLEKVSKDTGSKTGRLSVSPSTGCKAGSFSSPLISTSTSSSSRLDCSKTKPLKALTPRIGTKSEPIDLDNEPSEGQLRTEKSPLTHLSCESKKQSPTSTDGRNHAKSESGDLKASPKDKVSVATDSTEKHSSDTRTIGSPLTNAAKKGETQNTVQYIAIDDDSNGASAPTTSTSSPKPSRSMGETVDLTSPQTKTQSSPTSSNLDIMRKVVVQSKPENSVLLAQTMDDIISKMSRNVSAQVIRESASSQRGGRGGRGGQASGRSSGHGPTITTVYPAAGNNRNDVRRRLNMNRVMPKSYQPAQLPNSMTMQAQGTAHISKMNRSTPIPSQPKPVRATLGTLTFVNQSAANQPRLPAPRSSSTVRPGATGARPVALYGRGGHFLSQANRANMRSPTRSTTFQYAASLRNKALSPKRGRGRPVPSFSPNGRRRQSEVSFRHGLNQQAVMSTPMVQHKRQTPVEPGGLQIQSVQSLATNNIRPVNGVSSGQADRRMPAGPATRPMMGQTRNQPMWGGPAFRPNFNIKHPMSGGAAIPFTPRNPNTRHISGSPPVRPFLNRQGNRPMLNGSVNRPAGIGRPEMSISNHTVQQRRSLSLPKTKPVCKRPVNQTEIETVVLSDSD